MLNFCPQCGSKLQSGFKFCPSCGGRLPEAVTEAVTSQSSEPYPNSVLSSLSAMEVVDSAEDLSQSALIRPPLRSTRRKTLSSTAMDCIDQKSLPSLPSSRKRKTSPLVKEEKEVTKKTLSIVTQTPGKKSLTSPGKGKASPQVKEQEEAKQTCSVTLQTPDKMSPRKCKASPQVKDEAAKQPSSVIQSPPKSKGKKRVCIVEPVQEGLVVCDQSSKKWKLVELLWQTELDLTYAVCQANQHADSNECKYILRLGAKEGHLFNEQNFHLRAAKPDAVEKWLKSHKLDFLGIPSCVGFGLHEASRYISDIPGLLSCCYKQKKASSALQEYLSTVMTLQYTEKPDYTLLKAGLHESLQKMGGSLKESLNL